MRAGPVSAEAAERREARDTFLPVIEFDAGLEPAANGFVRVALPSSAAAELGARGRIDVAGTIAGAPFRTSVFRSDEGELFMLINKQTQSAARVGPGDIVAFAIEKDSPKRALHVPDDVQRALTDDSRARDAFASLSRPQKLRYLGWIEEAKTPAARAKYIGYVVQRLREGKGDEVPRAR